MALTSQIRYVRALDTTSTTGAGKTGLAFGDFTAKYLVNGGTLTSLTTETITTLGTYQAPTSAAHVRIKELSSSDPCKGLYEVHFHDTTLATGAKLWLFLSATGALIQPLEIDLLAQSGDAYALVNSGTFGNSALKTLIDAVDDYVDTEVAAIKAKTDQLTFTTANKVDATVPDTQKVDINTIKTQTVTLSGGVTIPAATLASTTNITAGTITTATNLTNAPTSGDLTAAMKTSVNGEVVDALATDTYVEPGQGAPAATTTLAAKINYLYKAWRNKKTQTSSTYSLLADDASTVDQKATVSDDGTTTTVGEIASGP